MAYPDEVVHGSDSQIWLAKTGGSGCSSTLVQAFEASLNCTPGANTVADTRSNLSDVSTAL